MHASSEKDADTCGEVSDTENDDDSGRGEYVSILRSAVNRGCNVTLMGRVYGNYKKRKLNIEHIVPRAVILTAISNSSAMEEAHAEACSDLYNM